MIEPETLRTVFAAAVEVGAQHNPHYFRGVGALIIDARTELPEIIAITARPWAMGELRQRLLARGEPSRALLTESRTQRWPVVLLSLRDRMPGAALLDAIFGAGLLVRTVLEAPDGALSIDQAPIAWAPRDAADRSATTHLRVRARREHWFRRIDLPIEIEIELPEGDDARCLVGLEVESDYAHQLSLPAPAWYHVRGPERRGVLLVDVEARADGDAWDVSFNGDATGLRRAEPPPASPVTRGLPERLAVIFDRTCPDRVSWARALAVAVGGARDVQPGPTKDVVWGDEAAEPAQAPLRSGDLNREIRTALGESLRILLEGKAVSVDGYWFADIPGEGISSLDGVVLPGEPYGVLRSGRGEALGALFDGATYSPGLDLWDPLEGALRLALTHIEESSARRGAVLIVGNSPPNVPADGDSPLRRVLRAFGSPTSYRRSNAVWDAELRRAHRLDVPIVYLFLEHALGDGESRPVQRDYERSVNLAHKVARALEDSLPLVRAQADSHGVLAGLNEALLFLSGPRAFSSTVEVWR